MYLSCTDVIAEDKKKSGSGFRLSFFQSLSSTSQWEEKCPGVWSSNLNEPLKKHRVSINLSAEPGTESRPFLEWGKHIFQTDLDVMHPSSLSSPAKRLPFVLLQGFSCWMMCMSEVTEWDTPLQRHQWQPSQKKHQHEFINQLLGGLLLLIIIPSDA